MRVLYDGFIFDFQPVGGINRYFCEIIDNLPESYSPSVTTFMGKRAMWPSHPRLRTIRSRPFARAKCLRKVGDLWMKARMQMVRGEIFHPTYYNLLTKRKWLGPSVITVFDMIHEMYPYRSDPLNVTERKREAVKKASVVLCISESTRRDLTRIIPETAGKCCVTPLAVSSRLKGTKTRRTDFGRGPYFLYVGGRSGYKRFADLVECWGSLSESLKGIRLKVVGSNFTAAEVQLLNANGVIDKIEHEGQVPDEKLANLYAGSLGLIYTSEYEGFGLPLLEAMQNGAPVVCCNTSSLPEVGGNAVLYFQAGDLRSLCHCIQVLVESSEVRNACISSGYEQAARFSWEKTTRLTVDAYRWAVDDFAKRNWKADSKQGKQDL